MPVLLRGQMKTFNTKTNPNFPQVQDINCEQVKEYLTKAALIDVRAQGEYEDLPKLEEARHILLDELLEDKHQLDASQPIIFICRSGGRSAKATAWALEKGLTAYNMAGGMLRWKDVFGL